MSKEDDVGNVGVVCRRSRLSDDSKGEEGAYIRSTREYKHSLASPAEGARARATSLRPAEASS